MTVLAESNVLQQEPGTAFEVEPMVDPAAVAADLRTDWKIPTPEERQASQEALADSACYHIAVVGGGPAGAAMIDTLTKQAGDIPIHIWALDADFTANKTHERSSGVAPWHEDLRKSAARVIGKSMTHSLVSPLPGVEIGERLSVNTLAQLGFDAIVLTPGATLDRPAQLGGKQGPLLTHIDGYPLEFISNFAYQSKYTRRVNESWAQGHNMANLSFHEEGLLGAVVFVSGGLAGAEAAQSYRAIEALRVKDAFGFGGATFVQLADERKGGLRTVLRESGLLAQYGIEDPTRVNYSMLRAALLNNGEAMERFLQNPDIGSAETITAIAPKALQRMVVEAVLGLAPIQYLYHGPREKMSFGVKPEKTAATVAEWEQNFFVRVRENTSVKSLSQSHMKVNTAVLTTGGASIETPVRLVVWATGSIPRPIDTSMPSLNGTHQPPFIKAAGNYDGQGVGDMSVSMKSGRGVAPEVLTALRDRAMTSLTPRQMGERLAPFGRSPLFEDDARSDFVSFIVGSTTPFVLRQRGWAK